MNSNVNSQLYENHTSLKSFIWKIFFICLPIIILSAASVYEIYELDIPTVRFDKENVLVSAYVSRVNDPDEPFSHVIKYSWGGVQYDKVFDGYSRYFMYYMDNEQGDEFNIYVNKNNPEKVSFIQDRPVRVTKGYNILLGVVGGITFLIVLVEIIDRVQKNNRNNKSPEIGSVYSSNTNSSKIMITKYDVMKSHNTMIICCLLFFAVDMISLGVKIDYFHRLLTYDMVIADINGIDTKVYESFDEETPTHKEYEVSIGYTYNDKVYNKSYTSDRTVSGEGIPVFINPQYPDEFLTVKRDADKFLIFLALNIIPCLFVYRYSMKKEQYQRSLDFPYSMKLQRLDETDAKENP